MSVTPAQRNPRTLIHLLLILVALLCELAAMAVALDWFDGNWQALVAGGLSAYLGAIFLNSLPG